MILIRNTLTMLIFEVFFLLKNQCKMQVNKWHPFLGRLKTPSVRTCLGFSFPTTGSSFPAMLTPIDRTSSWEKKKIELRNGNGHYLNRYKPIRFSVNPKNEYIINNILVVLYTQPNLFHMTLMTTEWSCSKAPRLAGGISVDAERSGDPPAPVAWKRYVFSKKKKGSSGRRESRFSWISS